MVMATEAVRELRTIHALLFPEQYPRGSEYHDPAHLYWWQDDAAPMYEWRAETIEWVATHVWDRLEALGAIRDDER